MPAKFLIEGASFRGDLEPELIRLLSEIWNRKADPLRPCWILIPAQPLARHLKKVLLDAGVPLLNVELLTVKHLRDRLPVEPALAREKQELLLRCLLRDAERNQEAAPILREAIDAMRDAGHPGALIFDREGGAFRRVAEDFESRVGPKSVQHLDREALKHPNSPVARDVILYGFDAGDWPGAWALLAALNTAERSAVFYRNAGGQVESFELAWMAWWHEHYGGGPMPAQEGSNFEDERPDALVELEKRMFVPMRVARAGVQAETPLENADDSVVFLRHRSASLEARDVAALAAAWAGEIGRVGLIFAGPNALSRLAAAHLEAWKVPFEDQLGSPSIDPPENAVLRIWLQMQEEGPHGLLIEQLGRSARKMKTDVPVRRNYGDCLEELIKELDKAKSMTMSDDIHVMAKARGNPKLLALAAEWEKYGWPQEADAPSMIRWMEDSLDYLFGELAYELESGLLTSLDGLNLLLGGRALPRTEWVRYLMGVMDAADQTRRGGLYAPLVITSLDRGRGESFDAVIFCGLNEGFFPQPLKELPFQLDARAPDFDAAASKLDPDDLVRRFGKWHAPILSFSARRGLERQRFWDLISNARKRVCFSHFEWDDLEDHDGKEPSELFDWAWWAKYGFQKAEVRAEESARIERQTAEWSSRVSRWLPKLSAPADLESMLAAVRRRFDPGVPCDEFQFVHPSSDVWKRRFEAASLQVNDAEDLLKDPVHFWLKKIIQVAPRPDPAAVTVVPSRRGSLLHETVRMALEAGGRKDAGLPEGMLYPIEGAGRIRRASVDARIDQLRSAVSGWFGRVPLWWQIELSELRLTALCVLEFLSAAEAPETPFATEWSLDGPLGGILWAARLDHVIRKNKDWIVTDLKTGGGATIKELKAARLLENGEGFQLAIYAMILAARLGLDPARIALRYHQPRRRGGHETVKEPFDEMASAATTTLAYLKSAWGSGCFGQRSDRDQARPLAHLPVPDEILRLKWNRTGGLQQWPWVAPGEEDEDAG